MSDVAITSISNANCTINVVGTRDPDTDLMLRWGTDTLGEIGNEPVEDGDTNWTHEIELAEDVTAQQPDDYFYVRAVIYEGSQDEVSTERRFSVNCDVEMRQKLTRKSPRATPSKKTAKKKTARSSKQSKTKHR